MKKTGFKSSQPAVINFMDQAHAEKLLLALNQKGVQCHVINGGKVDGKNTFLKEAGNTLFDNGEVGGWDEFESLYREWLAKNKHASSALILTHVHQMLDGNLDELIELCDIFTSATRKLYAQGQVHLHFLLGEGSNFPGPDEL